jgi:YfiR/HmsC-like
MKSKRRSGAKLSGCGLKGKIFIFTLFSLFVYSTAFSGNVPFNLQAKFLFTILSHDRNLSQRADTVVTIAVLSGQGSNEIKSALSAFEEKTVKGMPIKVIEIESADGLLAKLREAKVTALYISGGQLSNLSSILAATGSSKTLSFGTDTAYIAGGVGVVIKIEGGKPKLVVNLSTTNKEGVKLGANVLRLADVID